MSGSDQDYTQYTDNSAPPALEFSVGQIVGDNYEVLAWIGAGGMGNVYRVRHTILNNEYALKSLSADKVTESAWGRFQNEAQAIARMNHPNIVGIYNLGLEQGHLPFYVMDLLKGRSLADMIAEKGFIEPIEAMQIFIEVSAGLSYAHKKGIVHRDVKPANIIILDNPGPGSGKVKIVDFGIAKLSGVTDQNRQNLTSVGEICGSPFYMSPEQCEGGKVDARSDIYSLGCALFEALAGNPPFRGRNGLETMMMHQNNSPPPLATASGGRHFPSHLDSLLANLLAKRPMDRLQNMDGVNQSLNETLNRLNRASSTSIARPKTATDMVKLATATNLVKPIVDEGQSTFSDTASRTPRPAINYKALIAMAALLVVAVSTATFLVFKSENAKLAPVALVQPEDIFSPLPLEKKVPPLSPPVISAPQRHVDDKPFTGATGYAQAGKAVVFDFPGDLNLGEIMLDSPLAAKGKKFICQGKQTIPAGHKLFYFPSEVMIETPQFFQKFHADDLYSVTMPATSVTLSKKMPLAIIHLCSLKGLKRLDLHDCNGADAGILPVLERMTNLTELDANPSRISSVALGRCRVIKNLKILRFGYRGLPTETLLEEHIVPDKNSLAFSATAKDESLHSITPLVLSLRMNSRLEVLEIPRFSLNLQNLGELAKIKTLREVDFSDSDLTSSSIEQLAGLNNLQIFHADRCNIDSSAIPAFQKLEAQSLREIHIKPMDDETLKRYRLSLPKVKVNQ